MLFKSLPPSHRVAIFLAANVTAYPLVKWWYGQTTLRVSHFIVPLTFWTIVVFQALERKYPSWRTGSVAGAASQSNLIFTWFDRAPASVRLAYWVVIILGAVLIYLYL